MNTHQWLIWIGTPVIGGLIGWFTNYLAVRMLFHPRVEKRFLGLRIQGLIPKRRHEIAESISQTVARELLTVQDVKSALLNDELRGRFSGILRVKVGGIFQEKLADLPPMIRTMVPAQLLESIQEYILKEIMNSLPPMVDELSKYMEEKAHLQDVVKKKIVAFELDQLESIVLRIAGRELRHIEFLGGVLGALIGLANAALIFAAQYFS